MPAFLTGSVPRISWRLDASRAIRRLAFTFRAERVTSTHANCPNGGTALGGGYAIVHDTIGGSAVPDIITNGPRYPSSSGQRPQGWEVDVVNETGDGVTVYPQVVCTR